MIVFPPCKINLGLHVLSRRPDGFHEIETCFYPIPLTDILEIIPSSSFSFFQTGIPLPDDPLGNLCVKVYEELSNDYVVPPVSMHLHKCIPTGAGLGGGSSDAAYTLHLLNSVFELSLSEKTLHRYASRLGSDCAFFLQNSPMIGKGRGELLSPIRVSLKGKYLVLVKPAIHLSTAQAYKGITPKQPPERIEEILKTDIQNWRKQLFNDFEDSIFRRYPEIGIIKDTLYGHGALYASMTGSGSAVYGIFEKQVDLSPYFKDQFCWSGLLS
jgi:4-diphosphocytidyl-2-C-methyl-D-erythritol kinase